MKRKSVWLSFTACALTAASMPLPARAVQRVGATVKTQVCQMCPIRTGIATPATFALSESAKGAAPYQPGVTPQVSQPKKRQG